MGGLATSLEATSFPNCPPSVHPLLELSSQERAGRPYSPWR
ncbi:hypothetical protein [Pseudonocardia sp. H11422]|nr:hypothetical protein [Pseudonocardia sp. H11422]